MTTSSSDVVTVRGQSKAYGGRVVVHELDLDVHQGEVVSLIGANGAGKDHHRRAVRTVASNSSSARGPSRRM